MHHLTSLILNFKRYRKPSGIKSNWYVEGNLHRNRQGLRSYSHLLKMFLKLGQLFKGDHKGRKAISSLLSCLYVNFKYHFTMCHLHSQQLMPSSWNAIKLLPQNMGLRAIAVCCISETVCSEESGGLCQRSFSVLISNC